MGEAQILPFVRPGRSLANDPQEQRLTRKELALILNVSEQTVYRWTKRQFDPLPCEPWGPRLVRYKLSHALTWRKRQRARSSLRSAQQ